MRLIHRLKLAGLCLWLAMQAPLSLAGSQSNSELIEGQMRYALLTSQPMQVLALVPDDNGKLTPAMQVLRGQALHQLGLNRQADQHLSVVGRDQSPTPSSEIPSPEIKAQALYVLGLSALDQGDSQGALGRLRGAFPLLTGESQQQAAYWISELSRRNDDLTAAGKMLGQMQPGYWAAMGYLNLATSFAKSDSDPSRAFVALRVAAAMAEPQTGKTMQTSQTQAGKAPQAGIAVQTRTGPETRELKDRINIVAAYLALKHEDAGKATNFLNKVALNSYFASQGLYLHGLAMMKQNNPRLAIQSWHRARKFPVGFSGAGEAMLGIGQAFDAEGSFGLAGDAYIDASAAFERELVNVDAILQAVRQEGAYKALILAAQRDNVEWFLADSKTLTAPRLAYLMRFMEDADAQVAANRVTDLVSIDDMLSNRQRDLAIFEQMLSHRLQRINLQRTSGALATMADTIERLELRRDDLRIRLQQAIAQNDVLAVVAGDLSRRLIAVSRLEQEAANRRDRDELLARIARVKGALLWQSQEQYTLNQRSLQTDIERATADLSLLRESLQAFNGKVEAAPLRFKSLLDRVRSTQNRVTSLRTRLKKYRAASESTLDQVVIQFFAQQKERVSNLLDRTNQEVVHLYEFVAAKQRADAAAKQAAAEAEAAK